MELFRKLGFQLCLVSKTKQNFKKKTYLITPILLIEKIKCSILIQHVMHGWISAVTFHSTNVFAHFHFDITTIAPTDVPRIFNDPILLTIFWIKTPTNDQHGMVRFRSITFVFPGIDTAFIIIEIVTSSKFKHDRATGEDRLGKGF